VCNVYCDIIMFRLLLFTCFVFVSVSVCDRHDSVKMTDENFWSEAYSLNCSAALITSVLYHVFTFCYHIAVILTNLKCFILMPGVSW